MRGWMDGWIDRWMNRWMSGWMDGMLMIIIFDVEDRVGFMSVDKDDDDNDGGNYHYTIDSFPHWHKRAAEMGRVGKMMILALLSENE